MAWLQSLGGNQNPASSCCRLRSPKIRGILTPSCSLYLYRLCSLYWVISALATRQSLPISMISIRVTGVQRPERSMKCVKTGAKALEILHFCPKSVQKATNWYPSKKNTTDRYKATEVIRKGSLGLQLCSLEFSKNPQVSDREIFPKVRRANLGRDIFPIISSRIVSNDHSGHWSYEQSMENVRWTQATRLEDKIQR